MDLIDSHCHLTSADLRNDLLGVLARAAESGVRRLITVATDMANAQAGLEIVNTHREVYLALGVHPHNAARVGTNDFRTLADLLKISKVVAVGETGLDFHYDFSDRPSQRRAFETQLSLARHSGLPVIVHSRKALDETIAILRTAGMRGRRVVFHCFSGNADDAARIADCGWRLSFTGMVTFANAKQTQAVARTYPADLMMVETDAPYLSPVPMRHHRPCQPAFLAHTVRFLADLRHQAPDELARCCTANTVEFFGLPESESHFERADLKGFDKKPD